MSKPKSFKFVGLLTEIFEANNALPLIPEGDIAGKVKAAQDRRDSCIALIDFIQANGDEIKQEIHIAFGGIIH